MQCTLAAVKAGSEWHVTLYLCVFAGRPTRWPDAAAHPGGTPHHFFFSIAFAFCRLPACHDMASAEYEDVCVSESIDESVPGIFHNNNPVGKCLPHPALPFPLASCGNTA